jgi:hypothetical protein
MVFLVLRINVSAYPAVDAGAGAARTVGKADAQRAARAFESGAAEIGIADGSYDAAGNLLLFGAGNADAIAEDCVLFHGVFLYGKIVSKLHIIAVPSPAGA